MASYPLTRGSKSAPNTDVLSDALIAVLEGHNAALKANVERLEADNTALKADIKNLKTMLAAERERADRAIRAFESQAKLEAMAEANATQAPHRRPWWRRSPWIVTASFAVSLFGAAVTSLVLLDRAPNQGLMDSVWPSSRIAHVVNAVIADAVSARDLAARIGLSDKEDERR